MSVKTETQQAPSQGLAAADKRDDGEHALWGGDMAESYIKRSGGCNPPLADTLIDLVQTLLPPSDKPLRILDNGCGPAIMTSQCLKHPAITNHRNLHISAVDIGKDFVASNRSLIANHPEWNQDGKVIDTAVEDACNLSFRDKTFDASFTALAIFAFPDPAKAARELYRTLKPGGVTAVSMFKGGGWQPVFYETESIIRPGKEHTAVPLLDQWKPKGKLEQILKESGFVDVIEGEASAMAWWDSAEEAAANLTDTVKMLVGDAWSATEKGRMAEEMANVIRRGGGGVIHDGDQVGFEVLVWMAVGRR